MKAKGISQAVIARLPRYYRYLGELKAEGRQRISSQELSDIMKVTASQIRQDFNNFGGFGQQGYGYNVDHLHEEIGRILGLDQAHRMILVGCGNLGQALLRYVNFPQNGFRFLCAFDSNKELLARVKEVHGVPLLPDTKLESFIKEQDEPVDIAVIAVPGDFAQGVAERLERSGIRALWNFAPIDLEVSGSVTVENVHLQDSLMKLSYNIAEHETSAR